MAPSSQGGDTGQMKLYYWKCTACGKREYKEAEVGCWNCKDGEMVYQEEEFNIPKGQFVAVKSEIRIVTKTGSISVNPEYVAQLLNKAYRE